jgi:hypothetical protein
MVVDVGYSLKNKGLYLPFDEGYEKALARGSGLCLVHLKFHNWTDCGTQASRSIISVAQVL